MSRNRIIIVSILGSATLAILLLIMFQYQSDPSVSNPTYFQMHNKIVFSAIINGPTHQIYTVNSDGSDLTNLTNADNLTHLDPVSSRDGSKIAYVTESSFFNSPLDRRRGTPLYAVAVDGTNRLTLVNSSSIYVGRHLWSPDGTKIAYEANDDIFVISADGTNIVNLTKDGNATSDYKPTWASDNEIIFESIVLDRDNSSAIVPTASSFREVEVDTGKVRKLFDLDYNFSGSHVWSPDLKKIAFLQANDELSPASLYVMNAGGQNQTRLTASGAVLFIGGDLAWSPDSKKIAFGTIGGIYAIDIGDGTIRQLTSVENDSNTVWSSDGKTIAFTRIVSEQEAGIYIVNSDGSGQMPVVKIRPSIINSPLDWLL